MYRTHTQLTTNGAGPDGFQSLVSIITMMQDCSLAWLASEPVMAAYLEREHVAMLLASRQLEVCRRAHLGEELTVATSIFAFNRLLGHRNTCIYDADGALVAKSRCVGVFVSRDTGKTVRLPQEVVDSLVYDPEIPVDVSAKKIHVPDVAPDRVEHVRARFSDVDFNGHVNNAQYVRMPSTPIRRWPIRGTWESNTAWRRTRGTRSPCRNGTSTMRRSSGWRTGTENPTW